MCRTTQLILATTLSTLSLAPLAEAGGPTPANDVRLPTQTNNATAMIITMKKIYITSYQSSGSEGG